MQLNLIGIFGKPSLFFLFVSVFLVAFLSFDFYMVLCFGEIMQLRSAKYVQYDAGAASAFVFFLALLIKVPSFFIALMYVFFCMARFKQGQFTKQASTAARGERKPWAGSKNRSEKVQHRRFKNKQ